MKAFPSLPVLSALARALGLAFALGASGAYAQSTAQPVQTAPVAPPAASSSAMPPPAASSPADATSSSAGPAAPPADTSSSPGADPSAGGRSAGRYGRAYGRGPGPMGGYGPGPGPGWGGPGPGGSGWWHGPGGGWGPAWGAGPGMMGGPGPSWGMGPGMMMGGHGFGPGAGLPGPWRALAWLDLDDSQRRQLRELQRQQRRAHWELMGRMIEETEKLHDAWDVESGTRDRAAILAANQRIADLRRQMLESQLDAADQIDRILTPEQRERLRSGRRGPAERGRR